MAEDAPYQSLYRKYRPQSPAEVIGQDHVVRSLVGAIREQRLAHAFLFCGPKGTGKTSTARILAKMVNCEKGPTAEPCGVCTQCVAIRENIHLDVVEIDAASHGGVDDARELRERAPTAPVMGREKVYIIDEAQRLSREAFDALLKIFEEPPPGVRFVLATTEPHKVPATIAGRCQRFDFRRGTTDAVARHLERVAAGEGVVISSGAAEALARQADGSFRDALSLLDQCSVLGGGEIGEETVALLVGEPEGGHFELADAVAVQDTRGVFEVVGRLIQQGQDVRHLTGQILGHFRDLLVVHSAPSEVAVIDAPGEMHARLAAQASKFTTAELSRILSLLVAAQTEMRWSTSPRLTLELALVRSTIPEADPTAGGMGARIERLERLAGVAPGPPARTEPMGTGAAALQMGEAPEPPSIEVPDGIPPADLGQRAGPDGEPGPHAPSADSLDLATIRRSWQQVLDRLHERRQPVLRANLESATAVNYQDGTLELAFPPGRRYAVAKVQEREGDLREVLNEVLGISPRITCVAREPGPGGPLVDLAEDEEPASADEAVARLKAELGAEVEEG